MQNAIEKTVNYFTRLNSRGINCVNKGATTLESYKEDVYEWLEKNIDAEFRDTCWEHLYNAAWGYDILTPYIYDDGTISDIACHSWDNVWVMERGVWRELDEHFRSPEHYDRFFLHVCMMHSVTLNAYSTTVNCTDITSCPDFRLRLNFMHSSINTDRNNVFSIRKIPTKKKTLEDLSEPREGMLTKEMIPIIRKHLKEATGVLIVGMGGSGKTTFLNALFEELPKSWKYMIIQENEELHSETRRNSDFLKTVQGINKYDASHDLKELSRNGLLLTIKCFIIGETKGAEALYLFNVMATGAFGITTAHSSSSKRGLDKIADYIMYESGYTKDQCMDMLTVMNKVFFLENYRLREITTINGYSFEKKELICDTEYYDPYPVERE